MKLKKYAATIYTGINEVCIVWLRENFHLVGGTNLWLGESAGRGYFREFKSQEI